MKPEIKQLIIKELSDLKGRKVFKTTDARLIVSEKNRVPLETVKMYHTKYLEMGSILKTAKQLNVSKVILCRYFTRYNLPYQNRSEKHRQKRESNQEYKSDVFSLTYKEWCAKYNRSRGTYEWIKKAYKSTFVDNL
jgi:hypothetical protein